VVTLPPSETLPDPLVARPVSAVASPTLLQKASVPVFCAARPKAPLTVPLRERSPLFVMAVSPARVMLPLAVAVLSEPV